MTKREHTKQISLGSLRIGGTVTWTFPAVEADAVRVKAELWTGSHVETVSF